MSEVRGKINTHQIQALDASGLALTDDSDNPGIRIADGGNIGICGEADSSADLTITGSIQHTFQTNINRNFTYRKNSNIIDIASWTTFITIISSTTFTHTTGSVRCRIGGHTAYHGNGHTITEWGFDSFGATLTTGVITSNTYGSFPPGFRLTASGNNILLQAQSFGGVKMFRGGYDIDIFCPADYHHPTAGDLWSVT
ncbi:MAG: hypothetical protein GY862_02780 [Gammaproteobacteria bacterium]|nr:hypothetical protein [Gammaproteobacteria bacterium]